MDVDRERSFGNSKESPSNKGVAKIRIELPMTRERGSNRIPRGTKGWLKWYCTIYKHLRAKQEAMKDLQIP